MTTHFFYRRAGDDLHRFWLSCWPFFDVTASVEWSSTFWRLHLPSSWPSWCRDSSSFTMMVKLTWEWSTFWMQSLPVPWSLFLLVLCWGRPALSSYCSWLYWRSLFRCDRVSCVEISENQWCRLFYSYSPLCLLLWPGGDFCAVLPSFK